MRKYIYITENISGAVDNGQINCISDFFSNVDYNRALNRNNRIW